MEFALKVLESFLAFADKNSYLSIILALLALVGFVFSGATKIATTDTNSKKLSLYLGFSLITFGGMGIFISYILNLSSR